MTHLNSLRRESPQLRGNLSPTLGCLFNIYVLDSNGPWLQAFVIRKREDVSVLGSELHSDLCYLKFGAVQFLVGCQRLKLFKIDLRP